MPAIKGSAAVTQVAPESADAMLSTVQVHRLDEAEFAETWLVVLRLAGRFVDGAPRRTEPSHELRLSAAQLSRAAARLASATAWLLEESPPTN